MDSVVLPRQIMYTLSLGARFLYPILADKSRIIMDFDSFFTQIAIKAQDLSLDVTTPPWVFQGIAAGREVLLSQLPDLYQRAPRLPPNHPLRLSSKEVSQYLVGNQLRLCISDKGMGMVVVTQEWYNQICSKHLESITYSKVERFPIDRIKYETREILRENDFPYYLQRRNQMFTAEIPRFYGIIKIHKDPWDIRPIVPSHSSVTTVIASIVESYLHPLFLGVRTVIYSFQEVVKLFTQLQESSSKCLRIATGDVKAMYTNIDSELAAKAVEDFLQVSTLPSNIVKGLLQLLRIVNCENYLEFQDQYYHQLKGLAMGIACSPTVANLFAARYERSFAVSCNLYCRYIDDIFIVYQEDLVETSELRIPGLDIVWNYYSSVKFLDLEILCDGSKLHWRPYFKDNSLYQYIPWTSAHSFRIKRAVVLAELHRISSASKDMNDFLEARRKLYILFSNRGYPHRMLVQWFKRVSWPRVPSSHPPTSSVHSHYNPAWESVTMSSISQAIDEVWRRSTNGYIGLPNRLTKALKRTTSLYERISRDVGKSHGDIAVALNTIDLTHETRESSVDSLLSFHSLHGLAESQQNKRRPYFSEE